MCFNLASSALQSDRDIQHCSNSVLNYKSILLFWADRKVCQPEQLMARRRSIVVLLYKCVCVESKIFPFPNCVCWPVCDSSTHILAHTLQNTHFFNLKSLVTIKLHKRVSWYLIMLIKQFTIKNFYNMNQNIFFIYL